ncbi:SDR family NAD(P)-dependent oxidoreductase [Egbenema bharatensis]|uniref:SDR family NAD(P)-dependent oxidoreductase n=1 Tax=Egbenema bharatensis TaxID=3463334 RepID=UPI003A8A2C9C
MASTVLITGASQGIGKSTALLFARQGYNIVLAARNADHLNQVGQEITDLGGSALAIPTDVRQFEQVNHLVESALDQYGSIDVLINNAGIYISGPVAQFSLEDWHQAIDTNLWGYIHTIHALIPHWVTRGRGTIVNVGSIGGKVAIPYLTPYTTSKFAVTGLTEALRTELEPKGIHVCGVYPNLIKSSFLERAIFRGINEQDVHDRRQQVKQILAVPTIEEPDDVARSIWRAVKNQEDEVLVGSAKLSATTHSFFPGLMQWVLKHIFKNKD